MTWQLLAALPASVWTLLVLGALLPAAAWVSARWLVHGRAIGVATRLATRGAAVIGVGFGLLAALATLSVLAAGLEEARSRYLSAVVALSADLRAVTRSGWDEGMTRQRLALFRAQLPGVEFAAAWDAGCPACRSVAAEREDTPQIEAWLSRESGRLVSRDLRTLRARGRPLLIVSSALRDHRGAPVGKVAIGIDAASVADRAALTAVLFVALAYLLLVAVWWVTRRLVAAMVASRVRVLIAQVEAPEDPDAVPAAVLSPSGPDELSALAATVQARIATSVARQRTADRHAADARAIAARMEATATLAGGVAHDFNNLMMGVLANAQLLSADVADDEMRDTLATIADCAQRGGKLAQQLLAFARGGKYHPVVTDLNRIVREILRYQAHATSALIHVDQQLDPSLHHVDADPTQIGQVISNLCLNAVESISGEGRVAVITRNVDLAPSAAREWDVTPGPYVALFVADSGCGMTEDTRHRVFEPFFSTKARGRGLGLAAVYGIVKHHGGHVHVESAPAEGTTFTVYLPATMAPIPEPIPPETTPSIGEGFTILLVDDEESLLVPTRKLLERAGYRVLAARHGAEAVEIARAATEPIDLILLDMRMPVMGGAEAFPLLRSALPNVQIVLCSGYEKDRAAQDLLDAGAYAFVSKPFTIEALLEKVEGALRSAHRAPPRTPHATSPV